jgi:hypothetical protein
MLVSREKPIANFRSLDRESWEAATATPTARALTAAEQPSDSVAWGEG